MLLNNSEKLTMISNLLRAINDLEVDLMEPLYFTTDFEKKWPEIKEILTKSTIIEQIDLIQEHQGLLNSEENGELRYLKTQINAYLDKTPKCSKLIDSLKEKIYIVQKKIFDKFIESIPTPVEE